MGSECFRVASGCDCCLAAGVMAQRAGLEPGPSGARAGGDSRPAAMSPADLQAQREKIQREIAELEELERSLDPGAALSLALAQPGSGSDTGAPPLPPRPLPGADGTLGPGSVVSRVGFPGGLR